MSTFMFEKHECQAYGLFFQCSVPSREVLIESVTATQTAAGLRGTFRWDISDWLSSPAKFKAACASPNSCLTHWSTQTLNCLLGAGQPHWAAFQKWLKCLFILMHHAYSNIYCVRYLEHIDKGPSVVWKGMCLLAWGKDGKWEVTDAWWVVTGAWWVVTGAWWVVTGAWWVVKVYEGLVQWWVLSIVCQGSTHSVRPSSKGCFSRATLKTCFLLTRLSSVFCPFCLALLCYIDYILFPIFLHQPGIYRVHLYYVGGHTDILNMDSWLPAQH